MRAMDLDLVSFLDEFRAEASEHLRALDTQLLNLERNPSDLGPVREMFLSAHTIKGAAALLDLVDVRVLAHAMEDVLVHLRDGSIPVRPGTIDLLFRTVDLLRVQVQRSNRSQPDPANETSALVAALHEHLRLEAESASPTRNQQAPSAPAPRALIVENSATVRRLESMLLEGAGYEVDAVADGRQALDMALVTPYQLMVTGVETRGLKGLDLAAILRSQAFYRSLPIVVISSDENAEHRRRAAEIGVQAYIRKGEFGDRRLLQTAHDLLTHPPSASSPAPVAGMHVLIADDDAISRRMLDEAVRSLGHHVTLAHDGAQAWALAGRGEFDVIISDWVMPGIDGTELCRRVRECSSTPDTYTYFIVATSLSEKEHFFHAMEAGADDYLTKPFVRGDVQVRLAAAQRVTSLYRQKAQDSAELSRLNRDLFEQSRVDPLTQVGNRLRLTEDLDVLDARVQRYGHAYALAMFDVDHFKLYNDRYGHPAGDQALRSVAAAIRSRGRQGDTVYRYGGEEFLVVLPEQSLESARIAMEDMRRQIEDLRLPHEAKGPGAVVTVSIGVAATGPGTGETAPAALKRADAALYRAKESGRNRVVLDPT